MICFFALVWNPTDTEASAAAQLFSERLREMSLEWRSVFYEHGVEVWCRGGSDHVHSLMGSRGIVLGELFVNTRGSSSARAPPELDARESAAVLDSHGKRLIERYWGRYVAFLHAREAGGVTWVLRDPVGGLPCFRRRSTGVEVFFSNVADCATVVPGPYSIDWDYVAASICQTGGLYLRETGLTEVCRVLGGERVEFRAGRWSTEFLWDPHAISESEVLDDATEAAACVYRATQDAVDAWASCFRGVVHALSGGLDSSIVLACLREAPSAPSVVCFNYHSPGFNDDERVFARAVARYCGCPLVEQVRNAELDLKVLLDAPVLATPAPGPYFVEYSRYEANLACEHGANAIFYGVGGDQLFGVVDARFAARDYAVRCGLRPPLLRIASESAAKTRDSFWKVLWAAVGDRTMSRRWEPRTEFGRFRNLVRREVLEEVRRSTRFQHPLLSRAFESANGKRMQIQQLLTSFDDFHPFLEPTGVSWVAPLLSQGLLEICLRIPTYVLMTGGRDRAIARRAFERRLPHEVVLRETKAGPEEHLKRLFKGNRRWIREILLDGLLRQYLDQDDLERVVCGQPTTCQVGISELLDYLCTEVWLRQWTERRNLSATELG